MASLHAPFLASTSLALLASLCAAGCGGDRSRSSASTAPPASEASPSGESAPTAPASTGEVPGPRSFPMHEELPPELIDPRPLSPLGTTRIKNDAARLQVEFEAAPGWELASTRLNVASSAGELPLDLEGQPELDAFLEGGAHSPGETRASYAFFLDELPTLLGVDALPPGTTLTLMAYATVRTPGSTLEPTPLWAGAQPLEGQSLATFFQFTLYAPFSDVPLVAAPAEVAPVVSAQPAAPAPTDTAKTPAPTDTAKTPAPTDTAKTPAPTDTAKTPVTAKPDTAKTPTPAKPDSAKTPAPADTAKTPTPAKPDSAKTPAPEKPTKPSAPTLATPERKPSPEDLASLPRPEPIRPDASLRERPMPTPTAEPVTTQPKLERVDATPKGQIMKAEREVLPQPEPVATQPENPTRPEKLVPTESEPVAMKPEKPEQPVPTAPEPIAMKPEKPMRAAKPVPTEPEQPVPTKPDKPVPTKPEQPVPTKPDKPVPTKPEQPVPTKPDKPVPTKPEQPVPTKPDKPVPTKPEQPVPTKPEKPVPTKPEKPAPPTPTPTPSPAPSPNPGGKAATPGGNGGSGGTAAVTTSLASVNGINVGDFRTQTQGGWGTTAKGNNPGTYRDANFANAFPNGLVIGNAGGFAVTFTTSEAVQAFLPSGGTAAPLTENATDATTTEAGVLAAQVTALTLSVGFDAADPAFSSSATPLASLVVADPLSPCANMTVQQVLDEANLVLAGLPSMLTPSEANDCVSKINENFVDGVFLGPFLKP